MSKFLHEHGSLGAWLEQSELELRSLGEGETDAQGLKGRLEEHRKVCTQNAQVNHIKNKYYLEKYYKPNHSGRFVEFMPTWDP